MDGWTHKHDANLAAMLTRSSVTAINAAVKAWSTRVPKHDVFKEEPSGSVDFQPTLVFIHMAAAAGVAAEMVKSQSPF